MSCLIGIDVESISDIKAAVLKHERFIDRILTAKEKKQLQSRKGDAYYAYIAGRYSAKEAYAKAHRG
ncbi:hypothetical protein Q757_06375 [Oenococcus alcoholitolerans]|uniref:4'-phosphopantetheinyl transferase domain-containing protein n=1 Tax=Oenococcus alcoholitolerans TaxID=931074 RepID=A0ABR4XQ48_9LACO|nr:hypothetical protein Q757_06375 [Oenococcus alcoholitolerans]